MRKYIVWLLCAMLMLPTLSVGAQAEQINVDIEHLQVVKELGILEGFENYGADGSAISRAEFAGVIARIVNISWGGQGQIFADVDSSNAYYDEINTMYKLGIMVGDERGNFAPEKPVTYAQAVKCMIYILGYTAQAQRRGEYPLGYFVQAESLDILDNQEYSAELEISRAALAELIYNCLDVPLMDIISLGEKVQYSNNNNETILSRYLGIRRFEGVLTAVDGRSMLTRNEVTKEGQIKIGNTILNYKDSSIADYLGYRLEVYATDSENAIEDFVCAFPTKDNNELMIKISDLQTGEPGFSLTKVYYTDSSGEIEEAELTTEHRFMYNGAYDYDFDIKDFDFDTGYVKLIDNNDDDIYDSCLVWNYENYVMEGASGDVIACHYNKVIKKEQNATYRVLSNDGIWGGWELLTGLSNWDVMSVAKSKDGTLITVYANRGGVSGTVESVSMDEQIYAEIDGQSYVVSRQYMSQPANCGYTPIKPGLISEFYFDILGEIAAVYEVGSANGAYGYILGIQKESGLSEAYEIKIFTEKGKTDIYKTDEKIKFTNMSLDGVYKKSEEVLASFYESNKLVQQMVKFSANDEGVITEIQKFTDATMLGYNLDKFSRDFNMGTITTGSDADKFHFQDATSTLGTGSMYENLFHMNAMTKIFYMPKTKNKAIDEETMAIVDISTAFKNGGTYDNIQVFDCDDTYVAGAVVYSPEPKAGQDAPTITDDYFFAVTKIYKGLNADGEAVPMVRGVIRGAEKEFTYIYDDTIGEECVLEEGSIIRFEKTLKDELKIKKSNIVYSPSAKDNLRQRITFKNEKGEYETAKLLTCWAQVGRLWRKNGQAITTYVGNERPWANYLNSGYAVYKVTKNGVVAADDSILVTSTGNPSDMMDGSLIVFNNRYQYVREMFVIQE